MKRGSAPDDRADRWLETLPDAGHHSGMVPDESH